MALHSAVQPRIETASNHKPSALALSVGGWKRTRSSERTGRRRRSLSKGFHSTHASVAMFLSSRIRLVMRDLKDKGVISIAEAGLPTGRPDLLSLDWAFWGAGYYRAQRPRSVGKDRGDLPGWCRRLRARPRRQPAEAISRRHRIRVAQPCQRDKKPIAQKRSSRQLLPPSGAMDGGLTNPARAGMQQR